MAEWQPIETAPKDGTSIIIYPGWGTPPRAIEAHWRAGKRHSGWHCNWTWAPRDPTNWQPLPDPPANPAEPDETR